MPERVVLYRGFDLPCDEEVQFVGVHPVAWRNILLLKEKPEPTSAFREATTEEIRAAASALEPTGPVLWVARDSGPGAPLNQRGCVATNPFFSEDWGMMQSEEGARVPASFMQRLFPDLPPGECRAYRLVPVEGAT